MGFTNNAGTDNRIILKPRECLFAKTRRLFARKKWVDRYVVSDLMCV